VSKLLDAGVNIALGTDGSASNNDLDMIGEMRTAALLAKGVAGRAGALPAHIALEMATINGAKAIGLDDKIGSLEIGKCADITAINLAQIETQPIYDVISTIVYSASRSQVSDVWVNGAALLTLGQLNSVNSDELLIKANKWQEKLTRYHHRASSIA
jgi:5-methylthioadenosine/S-adenosylhomocysteine deaminase